MYYVVVPKTLWQDEDGFGEWVVVKGADGNLRSFKTVEEAREYGKWLGREFYAVSIEG
ncbi:hypothetical protein [Bacillus sp. JJ722]|uniref:hypothetical protein n=1 Tax=Bacillus sp. JJ722 TaxID=3122973 RepID=UPI003000BDFC